MELNTRCPECETVFAVSLEQLRLRKGYIRCIHCAQIFDGFEAVVPAEPQREPNRSAPAVAGEAAPPKPFSIGGPDASASAGLKAGEPIIGAMPPGGTDTTTQEPTLPAVLRGRNDMRGSNPASLGPSFTISDPHDRARARANRLDEPGADSPAIFVGDIPLENGTGNAAGVDYLFVEPRAGRRSAASRPEFFDDVGRRSRWMAPVWAVLILCGLVLLLAQGVYVYRAQLANAFPSLRPTLQAACERVSCSVPYERRIDSIAITGSALRSTAAPQNDVATLTLEVTLRNTFDRPQEWPTLVLDLKDASGTVVVRRNLVPATWVPPELRDGPFAAGQEITVQVPVSVRGLQANGYQLDKFFP